MPTWCDVCFGNSGNFGAELNSFDHLMAETMNGNTPPKFAMKSKRSPIPWAPHDREDLLLLLDPGESPPKTVEALLLELQNTLCVLLSEASSGEIEAANNRLLDLLPEEFKLLLPLGMLDDPRMPSLLLHSPAPPDSNLAEWKARLPDALKLPPMPSGEAEKLWRESSLDSFLAPLM
jgi:hypothetical protein